MTRAEILIPEVVKIVVSADGNKIHGFLEDFLSHKKIVDCFGIANSHNFNGMGDLAAKLVVALKEKFKYIYLSKITTICPFDFVHEIEWVDGSFIITTWEFGAFSKRLNIKN